MGWRRRRRRGSRPEQGAEQGGESGGESGGKWEEEWWGVEVEFVVCGAEVRGEKRQVGREGKWWVWVSCGEVGGGRGGERRGRERVGMDWEGRED